MSDAHSQPSALEGESPNGARHLSRVEKQRSDALRDDICVHIFTVSATLVGVCLTVIGVLRLVPRQRASTTLIDDILSANAILFLAACATAYCALRMADMRRRRAVERYADVIFMLALGLMTVACALLTYDLL